MQADLWILYMTYFPKVPFVTLLMLTTNKCNIKKSIFPQLPVQTRTPEIQIMLQNCAVFTKV